MKVVWNAHSSGNNFPYIFLCWQLQSLTKLFHILRPVSESAGSSGGDRSLNREAQTSLFLATPSGSSEVLPQQLGDIVLPPGPGPSLGHPTGGMCLEILTGRPSNQMSQQSYLALLHLASASLHLEFLTLYLTYSPDILQRTLISTACIHDLVLLVTDCDHRLGTEGGGLPCKLRALPFTSTPLFLHLLSRTQNTCHRVSFRTLR